MNLPTQPYLDQVKEWPAEGRHILAHYDDSSVVVYQAYSPRIGHFAARNGFFGGDFSFNRMTWVKPNFLWMMYRSGWGQKENQEVTLAIRLKRAFFDSLLEQAVASTFGASGCADGEEWQRDLAASEVRLQWDPDHAPLGAPVARRAIQLGLRGQTLREYARDAFVEIEDISGFVEEQRPRARPESYERLLTPRERVYVPEKPEAVRRLPLSDVP